MGKIVYVKNISHCLNCPCKGNYKTCFSIWCENQAGYYETGDRKEIILGYREYKKPQKTETPTQ